MSDSYIKLEHVNYAIAFNDLSLEVQGTIHKINFGFPLKSIDIR